MVCDVLLRLTIGVFCHVRVLVAIRSYCTMYMDIFRKQKQGLWGQKGKCRITQIQNCKSLDNVYCTNR
jgi:hypothetical protein